jgi:putative hemolysin
MEFGFLLLLIVLNGVFAMTEIALVTARRTRLAMAAEDNLAGAKIALALHDDPNRFLSTVQIGITSIGVLNGIVGEALLAEPLALQLQSLGMEAGSSSLTATAIVVLVITYLSIVVGELVPKRIGQLHPEAISRLVAPPMQLLSVLTRPFVHLLSLSTDLLLKLLRQSGQQGQAVTEEEIHALLQEGTEAGVIEQHEKELVRKVFQLDDRSVGSLMIPRADIAYLDLDDPLETNLAKLIASPHSRLPVCRGGLRQILGVATARKLLVGKLTQDELQLEQTLEPAVFIPETLTGMNLLEHFRANGTQMVLVVDEYGEVQGLVTLQDVLEALMGEFADADNGEGWAVQRGDGSWLLDGLMPLPELKDTLGWKSLPEEAHCHTLSGLLMYLLDHLPATGAITQWEDWELEVIDLDGKRVDKVLATRQAAADSLPPQH